VILKKKYGICGLCFHSPGCGVVAYFDENNRIVHLEPDPKAPLGRVLCPMANSVEEIVYSEKRLTHPLKRTGAKGTYDFEKITWDEAYDIIVDKLIHIKEKSGPQAAGLYAGTGSYERGFKDSFKLKGAEIYLATTLLFPYGSPNTFGVGAPCYTSLGVLAPKLTMGCLHIDMYSDVDNSDLIFVWGTDPSTSTPPVMFEQLKTAAAEGAEIVVIDPRRTKSTELKGSEWIPIRPGSDGALALGLAYILIRDNLYDKEFVDRWTLGFKEFSEYVRTFTPEYVAAITGISKETIEDLAERIIDAEGASYVMYTGLEYTKSGVQSIRAVMVLWALAGHLDVEGGRCFLGQDRTFLLPTHHQLESPGWEKSIGKDQFPVYAYYCGGEPHASLLPKAIIEEEPYSISALIVLGASLVTAWPNPSLWKTALEKLEFLVSIDLQLTRDAAYADIVLPATTAFEQASYCYYGNAIRYREQLIKPIGQSKSSYQIVTELVNRLGYGNLFFQHPEELLARILAENGYSIEDLMQSDRYILSLSKKPVEYRKWEKGLLRSDGRPGFDTPSGKFEIHSTVLEQFGYEGLPKYTESDETPFSSPDLYRRYPLILGTGPFKPDMKSCLRAIPSFIKKYPYPVVEINPEDAKTRKISTKDLVVLKTSRGKVTMRAHVTDKIMSGFVYAPVGGGGPQGTKEWQQANVNELTDHQQYDPISGFPVYKTLLCQIKKKKRIRKGIASADPNLGCGG
jgi:anaerobic selenocysteine-containing dehydrogenase